MAWLARFKNLHLTEAEARALVVAREVGAIDNATWRDTNKVDTLTASQSLKKLRDAGLFQQKGRGAATWYQPTSKMLGDAEGLSSNPDALSSNPGALLRAGRIRMTHPEARNAPEQAYRAVNGGA